MSLEFQNSGDLTLEDEPFDTGDQGLTLEEPNLPAPVQGVTATNRAAKNHLAMGNASPGINQIEASILTGQEEYLRRVATTAREQAAQAAVTDRLSKIVQSGQATPDQARAAVEDYKRKVSIDPYTVLEKGYADNYINMVVRNNPSPDSTVAQAMREAPEETKKAVTGTAAVVAGREILQRNLEDAEAQYEKLGVGSKAWAIGKSMIPLTSSVTMSPDWSPTHIVFPGSTLMQERDKYWSLNTTEEQKAWLTARTAEIAKSNPVDAITFARSMVKMPLSERAMMNVFGMMDAQTGGGVVAGLGKAAVSIAAMRKLLLQSTDAVKDGVMNTEKVYSTIGDLQTAGRIRTTREIFNATDPFRLSGDLKDMLPTHMNLDIIFAGDNAGNLARERANSLKANLMNSSADMMNVATRVPRGERVTPEMIAPMLKRAEEMVMKERPSINDAVLDSRVWIHPQTGVRYAEIIIGDKNGKLHRSANAADNYGQNVLKLDYEGYKVGNEVPEYVRAKMTAEEVQAGLVKKTQEATGFTTAKGSTYEIQKDGTTIRNKAKIDEPGHYQDVWRNKDTDIPIRVLPEKPNTGPDGRMYQKVMYGDKESYVPADEIIRNYDTGVKKPSLKTVYLTKEQRDALAPPEGQRRIADHGDGTLSMITRTHERPWGISPSAKNIPYSTTPQVGLTPLEMWSHKILQKNSTYSTLHFGHEITELKTAGTPTAKRWPNPKIPTLEEAKIAGDPNHPSNQLKNTKIPAGAAGETQQKVNQIVTKNQQGNGWYISIIKPLNETEDVVRAFQLTTKNTNPVNLANYWLGGLLRSAEDQLSYFQRGNRHIVTHAPQEIQRVFKEYATEIGQLSKTEHAQLERVLITNRDYRDFATNQRGKAYRSQSKLDQAFVAANGELPSEKASLTYWRYHQIMDMDWVMRNWGVHRDLARQGVELLSTRVNGKDIQFPGRFREDIPWKSREDFGIVVMDEDGFAKHYWKSKLGAGEKDHLDELVKNGYKTLQIANPSDRPLLEFVGKGKRTDIILVKDHTTKPLPMNMVDYQPGVHVIYPHPFYVKQPILEWADGVLTHFGDKNIYPVYTQAEAIRLSKAISEVQKMIKNGVDDVVMNAFIEKHLPEDAAFWRQQFSDYISLEHPIGHVQAGKEFYDTHLKPEGIQSTFNSEFNLFKGIDMDFLSNRHGPLGYITNTGTKETPVYTHEVARVMDPFVALNRGIGNAIRNLYINDAKISAIEQWTRQYAHLMDGDIATTMANPHQTFYNPKWNQATTNRMDYVTAHNVRERIINFLGTKSELDKDLQATQMRLMDKIGETAAGKFIHKEYPTLFTAPLEFIKDPITHTRMAMFDMRFGFFNPGQFIVQGMGAAHSLTAGITNWHHGMSGYILQRWMARTDNPDILNRYANIATKFGWTKEEFLESYNAMRNSGVDIIGREHALRDEVFTPSMIKTRLGQVLDWGRYPFTEGERMTRMVAWNTAFFEWRKANPKKALDNFGYGEILNRFDDLSSNMTRASNSGMQEGWKSVATQFLTFSHRMMEQFWGTRLSPKDKARAFLAHSTLFGIPVAASIPVFWPVYDSLRKDMLVNGGYLTETGAFKGFTASIPGGQAIQDAARKAEDGHPLMDDKFAKVFMDGFLSYAMYHISGKEFNIENRYGSGAPEIISKFLNKELTAIEAFGGPAGTFVQNMWKSTYPLKAALYNGLVGGNDSFQLTKDDVYGILREVSSVNNFHNGFYAINAGKYMSRYDSFVSDGLNWKDGAALIMGLMPKSIADNKLMIGSLKDQKDAQEKVGILAEREIKRALQALNEEDGSKTDVHFARAKVLMVVLGDFKEEMIAETYKRAVSDNQALVDKIAVKFATTGYKSQLPLRLERLLRPK